MTWLRERARIFFGLLIMPCQKFWTKVYSQQRCLKVSINQPPSTCFYHWQLKQQQTFLKLIHKTVSRFCARLHCFPCWWAELLKSPCAVWIQLVCTFCSFPLPIWKVLWKQAVIVCEKEKRFSACPFILFFLSLFHLLTDVLALRSQRILAYLEERGLSLAPWMTNGWTAYSVCHLCHPLGDRTHWCQWEKKAPRAQRGMEVNSTRGTTKNHLQHQLSIRKKMKDLSKPISASVSSPHLLPSRRGDWHTPSWCAL